MEEGKCEICKDPFPIKKGGRKRLTCGEKCRTIKYFASTDVVRVKKKLMNKRERLRKMLKIIEGELFLLGVRGGEDVV